MLGIGFAFLLLFATGKQSLPLAHYLGETQSSILGRASKFVLSPKPIDNCPGLVPNSRIRIGNLTFDRPSEEVWSTAKTVAESLTEIISHITMEQRWSYIKQQNRSRAIIAVQKWGVRRCYANSALNVAEIIKNTTLLESKVLAEANTWRRAMYDRLDPKLSKKIEKTLSYDAKKLRDSLHSSIRQKETPTKTPDAKVKNTPGTNISPFESDPPTKDKLMCDDDDEERLKSEKKKQRINGNQKNVEIEIKNQKRGKQKK